MTPTALTQTFRLAATARRGALAAFTLLLVAAAAWASTAGAAPARYEGSSADGSIVYFSTTEKLVPGDTDNRRDVYVRYFDSEVATYVTRESSIGPTGGNDAFDATFEKASADGNKAFFTTAEPLVAADTDKKTDVYVRDLETKTTSLVSAGGSGCASGCGNGPSDAEFAGATANGAIAFFVTVERLATNDEDSAGDVYMRSGAATNLVSEGNGAFAATMRGASADGSRAFFATAEQLDVADSDNAVDIYARNLPSGATELVSRGDPGCSPCGNDDGSPAVYAGSSDDGAKVFFETSEGLVAADSDGANDVYQRTGGTTTLVTAGSGSQPANFRAASSDGTRVLFSTAEGLVADTNGASDVYQWSGGSPSRITSGTCTQGSGCGSTFDDAKVDATQVFFTTTESLSAADTDSSADIYRVATAGGAPLLVSACSSGSAPSCGNGAASAVFNGASSDASKVYFTSGEQLVAPDSDSNNDVYRRDLTGSTTALASSSPSGGTCPILGGCPAVFSGSSSDGGHLFFVTEERLSAGAGGDDVDSETDVYDRDFAAGQTRLVSTDNTIALGPATPTLTGTAPASPGESTTPAVLGQAPLETSIKIYKSADCSGAPLASGTSAKLETTGIAVGVAVGSTTSFRATATDEDGDTSGCSAAVVYKQESVAPPPPPPAEEGTGGSGGGTGTTTKPKNGGITYLAPKTLITLGPAFKTRKRKVEFQFVDSTGQPGTKFRCKQDRKSWKPCSSPAKLTKLSRGKHVFRIKGINAVGTAEALPVKRAFKVVR